MKALMMTLVATMIAVPAFANTEFDAQSAHARHHHRHDDRGGWHRHHDGSAYPREDEQCPADEGYPGAEGRLRNGAGIPGPCLHQ